MPRSKIDTLSLRRRRANRRTIPASPASVIAPRTQVPIFGPCRVSVRSEVFSTGGATAGAGGFTGAAATGSAVAAVPEGGVDPVLPELSIAAEPAAAAAAFSRDSSLEAGEGSVDFLTLFLEETFGEVCRVDLTVVVSTDDAGGGGGAASTVGGGAGWVRSLGSTVFALVGLDGGAWSDGAGGTGAGVTTGNGGAGFGLGGV